MTIDIEKLISEIDEDGSGNIEYNEFLQLLSSKDWVSLLFYFQIIFLKIFI